jgi:rifampicin phosphotransferase
LIKAFGSERAATLMAQLTQGAKPAADADFASALQQVARGELSQDQFLKRFGHRGANEMELSAPRWAEAPETLAPLLNAASHAHTTPEHGTLLVALAKEAQWNPYVAKMVNHHVERTRTYIGQRETGKHYLMRGYAEIRRRLMELDRRWQLNGLLFEATLPELSAIKTGAITRSELMKRKRRRMVEASLEVPAVVFGDDLSAIGRPLPISSTATHFQGLALSAGVVEGVAWVLHEPQPVAMEAGYILVCPSTDPAWVPLFVSAGGLVMESGGTLSHGAIVAREFGLPAVAGIPDVMRQIQTGQRLRVDGRQGTVTVLE